MQKPDDIPLDVWADARDAALRIIAGEDFSTLEAMKRVKFAAQCTIARAILSDREKRAAIGTTGPVRHSEDGSLLLQAAMDQLNRAIGK